MYRVVYLGDSAEVVGALLGTPDLKLEACLHEPDDETGAIRRLAAAGGFSLHAVRAPGDIQAAVARMPPVDIGVVANFGVILNAKDIASTRRGFVNLHMGLLPQRPGRQPVRDAIAAGEKIAGVTLHWIDLKVDQGAAIDRRTVAVGESRDACEVLERLTELGCSMLRERLPELVRESR